MIKKIQLYIKTKNPKETYKIQMSMEMLKLWS